VTAGRVVGAIALAALIAFVIVFATRPTPPKEMLPFCHNPPHWADWCKNVKRSGWA
jgi:hypothetical protein